MSPRFNHHVMSFHIDLIFLLWVYGAYHTNIYPVFEQVYQYPKQNILNSYQIFSAAGSSYFQVARSYALPHTISPSHQQYFIEQKEIKESATQDVTCSYIYLKDQVEKFQAKTRQIHSSVDQIYLQTRFVDMC